MILLIVIQFYYKKCYQNKYQKKWDNKHQWMFCSYFFIQNKIYSSSDEVYEGK